MHTRQLLILCLLAVTVTLSAQTDYYNEIEALKNERHPLLVKVAKKGVRRYYSLWGHELQKNDSINAAIDIYLKALADTFLLPDDKAVLAVELAHIYNDKLLMHRHAYEVLSANTFSDDYPQRWMWEERMAETLAYMRRYDEALRQLNKAVAAYSAPPYQLLATRGYTHMQLQHHTKAVNDLRKAYELCDNTNDRYKILSNIALAHAAAGKKRKALRDIDAAFLLFEQSIAPAPHERDILLRKYAEIALSAGDTAMSAKRYKEYWYGEREYITSHFAAMTQQQRLDFWANRKPLVSGAFRLGRTAEGMLADLAIFRHQAALLGVHDTTEQVICAKLAVDTRKVKQCLRKQEKAVEFVKYTDRGRFRYAALVISPQSSDSARFVPLWTEQEISSFTIANKTLREAMCSPSAYDKNMIYTSETLAKKIWEPLMPYIDNTKDIWFAPDGILSMLAIEYLPYDKLKNTNFHRLSSTGMLAERGLTGKSGEIKALLVGGLDYNTLDTLGTVQAHTNQEASRYWLERCKKQAHFKNLPGSKHEVDNITHYIDKWDRYYQESEEKLKSEFAEYNLVHLSTHGYSLMVDIPQTTVVNEDSITTDLSLWAAGLALTGANIATNYPQRDDALISAREICELDLRTVDFVVTSACQSAQGIVSDEGPAGLLRGLKLAGAKTILATLWPVDDNATALFINFFYEEWNSGKGKDGTGCSKTEALKKAQSRLRQVGEEYLLYLKNGNENIKRDSYTSDEPIYDLPYFWAPFILVDDCKM